MGIKARVPERKPLIEAGLYVARCYEIIHLGEIFEERFSPPKWRDGIRVTWELPTELREFSEGDGEKPIAMSKLYNLSMFSEANLRSDVEGWLGKKLNQEEADSFEILDLLGKSCMLNIVHSEDGKYANVSAVTPLMKGILEPPSFNEPRVFDFEENFDPDIKTRFPEFIYTRIVESRTWKERIDSLESSAKDEERQIKESVNGKDLPF